MPSLGDVIVGALQELLRTLFNPITDIIENYGSELIKVVIGTPHPNQVFSAPTNGPWPAIYEYYWDSVVPLSLFLWAAAIGLIIFFESTSHLFSSYHRTKLKKRAFSGLLGILSWWWIAALSLRFMSALAEFIVPQLSEVTLFETLSFSGMGVLGTVMALMTDFTLFVLIALLYLMREVVLYLFVLLMPILIVLWVPGVGPLSLVSKFSRRLAGFYFPFLFMTIPVAILFRLGGLLGSSFDASMGGFGSWLIALVIPIIALIAPLVLFWQAGALFFVADRASQHVSRNRARARVTKTRDAGQTVQHGRRNFARGVRGEPAVTQGGQSLLPSNDSRAHAAGKAVRRPAERMRSAVDRTGGGGGGGSGSSGDSTASSTTETRTDRSRTGSGSSSETDRNETFDALRDRGSNRSGGRDQDDDRPYYID
ncbi:hypothetical protein [Halorientalis sp. IM1011]|uniref:hypothetical protein n=1 Tax=Halorientalis sp. IM1011 TaxID=1932360 RepID=UPI0012FBE98D|nr:hypothetical protein [Halorientalis sp. IM1011]